MTMRKVYKYISRILAVLTIYVLSLFSPVYGQTLSVFIFYGEDAVSYVEACQGSTVALTVQAFGGTGSGQTFTWTGDTNPLYFNDLGDLVSYKNTTPAGIYNLTVNVEDDGGFTGSASVTVEIKPSPLANIVANGATTFCEGNSVELEETSGQTGVAYQWQKNFSDISGANNYIYNADASGNYRIKVTGTNGCYKYSSTIVSVTVNSLPSATANNDGPVCYNGTVNLSSGPAGMVSYSWTTDATTPFSSSDQNPSITNVTPNNSGNYTVTVQDANGCQNSAITPVLVYNQLNGGSIGSDQTICYNGDPNPFTNEVSPSGGDGTWTITWEEKVGAGAWTTIAGENGYTYDIAPGLTQTTQYRRVATSSCGTVYSNTITVTVYADLDGGTISSNQSICYGGDPTAFNNDADASGGDNTFTYTWEEKVGAGAWTTISGATAKTYDVPSGLTQTTMYRRVATTDCGIAYSNELTVTVYDDITGGTISADQSVCYGSDPVEFTDDVTPAGGTGAWTINWEEKVGAGSWSTIAGANGYTYDIPAGITQTTMYRRVATNACGTANSNELTVTVYSQMDGGTIVSNQSLCYNSDPDPITSTLDPSGGNGPWTISWEYQSNCAGIWTTIAGETGYDFDPPAGQTETRCYRRVATNDCGTVYSNTVTVTIYADINGGTIASDQTVCNGDDPVAFTSTTDASGGNGAFSYFWEKDTGSGWTSIAGETNTTYDPPSGITQTTNFRRGATNSCGTGYSNTITVTVSDAVDGGQINSPDPVCYNGDPDAFVDLTSPSGGSGAWTISWEYKEGAGAWTVIAGESNLTYDIPAPQTTTRTYRRVATNSCGTGYSNEVTVTVYSDITSGTINGDQTLCYNSDPTAINNVTYPSGGDNNFTYSWEYQSDCAGGWIAISGETGESYDPPAGQTETRCYRRVETNTCGITYSNTVTITIVPEITGNTIAANQTICYNSIPAQLTGPIPGGGTGSYSYRWQKSTTGATGPFSNITGATAQNYTPGPLTQNTWYRRLVTSGSCINYSNVIAITVLPAVDNNTITADQDICYNTIPVQLDGSTPTGGDGTYTYQWQSSTTNETGPFSDLGGATSQNYAPTSPLIQSTWYRRIVNSGPCTDYYSNVIKVTVSPDFSVSSFNTTNPTCNGYNDGEATVNVTGGTPTYSYSWNTVPEQTSQTATGLLAGVSYTVVVTDIFGCQATDNVTLSQPDAIGVASKTVTPVTGCAGDANGFIEVLANGGTPDYVYTLYDGVTVVGTQNPVNPATAQFNGLTATTYTISITDANGCPAYTEDIDVTEPMAITISDVQTTPISCYGSSDGTITITASGGTGALEYSIDNGSTFQASNIFTVSSGYYEIIVRDANGCTSTWPTLINMKNPPSLYASVQFSPITTCYGENDGSITFSNVTGGTGTGYEFSIYQPEVWSSNPIFTGLPGGASYPYYAKVRDSNGCLFEWSGNPEILIQPSLITFDVTTTNVTTCWYNNNGTIKVANASGGSGSLLVSIDGINYYPTTKVFNVGVGSYTVYVKDENDCIVTKPAVISGPPEIVIDALTVTDATCFGAVDGSISSSASGGTGSLEYSIDGVTYQASGDFSGLSANNYTLYIHDANGCILTQDFTVGQPPALYFSTLDKTDITCNGLVDGTITLVAAGGSSPYNYSITGGAPFPNATGNFTSLSAGTYIPTVQDANGCITVGSNITIVEPDAITINSQSSTDITCFGANDGTITVEGIGGTAPLSYTLLDASSSVIATNGTGLFENIIPGTYTVEINDLNSCGPVVAGPFTINEPAELTFTYTTVDLVCNGDGNGEITVTASGGTLPYEYSFDGGATFGLSNTINTLSGGTYTVIVRDANGCTSSQDVTIIEPDAIALTVTATDITCNGDTNGQIDASATGGVDPMQFRLDGGAWQSSGTFAGLTANTYLIEAMDSKGCMVGDNATIVEPTAISIDNVTTVDPTCSTLGSIKVEASGGTGTLTYTLNPSAVSNTTGEFTGVGAGTYTVDVTDENGCGPISTAPIVINSPSLISIDNVNVTNVTGCYGNTNGEIEIIASGGTPPLAYSIDGGTTYQSTNTFTGLGGGTYTIMVNDINDCPQSDIVTITEPAEITIDNTTVNQESTPGASDGEIIVTASGGTGTLTYSITPNVLPDNTTGDFTGLGSGTYTVRVTDDNGCYVETGALVISSIDINITHTNVNCHGGTDGKITVTITGGFPPFTVVGTRISEMTDLPVTDEGGGVFTINSLSADTCLITITDNLSTVYTYQEIVTEPTQLIATYVSHTNPLCNGDTNGEVIFNIEGGTPFVTGTDSLYLIEWKDNGTVVGSVTDTIATGVGAGLYTFTISDQNGCSTDVDVPELIEPEPIKLVSLDQFDPTCYGEAIGTINATANGGTGVLRYIISGMLNDTTTTGVFENLPAGVYNLDVQDENGCSANFAPPVSVTLSEPAQIVISGLTPEDSLICPYDSLGFVRIQVSGGQPDYSYLWSNGQTSVDLEDVTSGDYTVTVTDALNCQVSKTFTVKGPQMLKLFAPIIDSANCKISLNGLDIGRIELTGSTGGNGSFDHLIFLWDKDAQTETEGKILGSIDPLGKVQGGIHTLLVTDTKNCKYTFEYNIPTKYNFNASAGKDTTVCYNNPVMLHGSVSGDDSNLDFTYKWGDDFDGNPIYIGQDTTVSLTASKTYSLWVDLWIDSNITCRDSATITLDVLPEIGLEVPLYISAVQDSIISVIKGKEFNVDVITKSVEYATAFEWKPSVMFNPSDSWNSSLFITDDIISQIPAYRDTIFSDPITKRPTNFIIVDVIATTERGCTDSIRLYTRIVDKLGFGNVFSPNGDGINDVWGVPKDYLFPDLSIDIFNRWGSLVWSAKGDKAAKGWNGKTNNGKELPLGTYYYVIKFNVKTQGSGWKPVTGSVTIVR
ncbi:MAG TPA: gliding motility-associated C-terminal domain-containing protein [Tenuifilaceae bacterium]|nr:gliding motility-associated C-terminal domain-containing protein [Tenuifilaceae bacterium]